MRIQRVQLSHLPMSHRILTLVAIWGGAGAGCSSSLAQVTRAVRKPCRDPCRWPGWQPFGHGVDCHDERVFSCEDHSLRLTLTGVVVSGHCAVERVAGFIDTASPPAGIWTALNQIPGPGRSSRFSTAFALERNTNPRC